MDEQAVLEALQSGVLTSAALDVFEQEPVDPKHPLLQMEHFHGTPHIGASTVEAQARGNGHCHQRHGRAQGAALRLCGESGASLALSLSSLGSWISIPCSLTHLVPWVEVYRHGEYALRTNCRTWRRTVARLNPTDRQAFDALLNDVRERRTAEDSFRH